MRGAMSQMLKSSGSMGAATLASRVLGMLRVMFYARFMGNTWVASAFVMAFMVPNLFRRLLGEGALTAAFIPIFKEKERMEGDASMWKAANAVLSGLLMFSVVIIGVGILAIAIALAFGSFSGKTILMLQLLRVMFPYALLVCLTAALIGMLNARGHFFVPALGAAVLNVVMIGSVLFLMSKTGKAVFGKELHTQIFGLAIGVLIAGVAQTAFQLPTLRKEGFRFRWESPWPNETVRLVLKKMLPASIGVAAFQINVMLTQGFAFAFGDGIVASFDYAVRLMELPQGLFGISLATYLLPTLSGLAAEKKYPEFRATLGQGAAYLAFLNLLASVLLCVLAVPMIRLLFEGGKFDAEATQRASWALACLAPGLISFSMVNIFARAFYALGDTSTPMKISLVCLGLNLLLTFLLIPRFQEGGLGMANTATSTINLSLLIYALRRKLKTLDLAELRRTIIPLLAATIVAGLVAGFSFRAWDHAFGHSQLRAKLGGVFVPMTAAALIYFVMSWQFRIGAAYEIAGLLGKKIRRVPASGSPPNNGE